MSIPDLREAACCFYCNNFSHKLGKCVKYGTKVDVLEVCAKFMSPSEIEGESS